MLKISCFFFIGIQIMGSFNLILLVLLVEFQPITHLLYLLLTLELLLTSDGFSIFQIFFHVQFFFHVLPNFLSFPFFIYSFEHTWRTTWFLSFQGWVISRNIVLSRTIHFSANFIFLYSGIKLHYVTYHIFIISLLMDI